MHKDSKSQVGQYFSRTRARHFLVGAFYGVVARYKELLIASVIMSAGLVLLGGGRGLWQGPLFALTTYLSGYAVGFLVAAFRSDRSPARALDFPKLWERLGWLFSPGHREQVWSPVIEEEKAAYIRDKKKCKTKWDRRWLSLCVGARTLKHLIHCLCLDKIARWLIPLAVLFLPERLRHLWRWWITRQP